MKPYKFLNLDLFFIVASSDLLQNDLHPLRSIS